MNTNIGNPPSHQPKFDSRLDDARVRPNEPGKDLIANIEQQEKVIARTHNEVQRDAVISVDNFVETNPNELKKAPDAVSRKADIINASLRNEKISGN